MDWAAASRPRRDGRRLVLTTGGETEAGPPERGDRAAALLDAERAAAKSRHRWRSSLRRLRFTREGVFYVLFTLGVGLAALNTGNNLLFLILGLLLSTILISGILAESALRGVSVTRRIERDPVAREPFLVTFHLVNHKRAWPSLALTIQEIEPPFAGAQALCLHLPAGASADVSVEATAPRRGHFAPSALRLSTRFPFGFFEKSRELEADDDLFVLPARRVLGAGALSRLGLMGERRAGRPGLGTELLEMRDLTAGDDRRRIHFRKSASVGRFLVAEREEESAPRLVLLIDNGHATPDELEEDLEVAAALLRRLIAHGHEVGLATSGEQLPPGAGPAHLRAALRRLARLTPCPGGPAPSAGRESALPVAAFRAGPVATAARAEARVSAE